MFFLLIFKIIFYIWFLIYNSKYLTNNRITYYLNFKKLLIRLQLLTLLQDFNMNYVLIWIAFIKTLHLNLHSIIWIHHLYQYKISSAYMFNLLIILYYLNFFVFRNYFILILIIFMMISKYLSINHFYW